MSLQLDGEASGARGFAGAPSAPSWVTPCASPTTSRECEQPIYWPYARNENSAQSRCQDSAHRVTSLSGTMAAYWALVGLIITSFAFLGVNMFLSGLHSYGEL